MDNDGSLADVVIKLSLEMVDEEGEQIFFYFNSFATIQYYLNKGLVDFVITDFYHYGKSLN